MTLLTEELLQVFRSEGELALQAGEQFRAKAQPLVERAAMLAAQVYSGKLMGDDTIEKEADLRAVYLNIKAAGAVIVAKQVQERFVAVAKRGLAVLFAALA